MRSQNKIWIGVVAVFLLMILAWAAMFTAASHVDVQSVPIAPPSPPPTPVPSAQSSYYEQQKQEMSIYIFESMKSQCSYYEHWDFEGVG